MRLHATILSFEVFPTLWKMQKMSSHSGALTIFELLPSTAMMLSASKMGESTEKKGQGSWKAGTSVLSS
jgi:hypothetical protein